jgi:hypothetical protein
MSLAELLSTPVTISRKIASGKTDEYGDEIPEVETVQAVGELQQQKREERGDQGEVSTTDWVLFLPAGTDIRTGDAVTIGVDQYQMVGDPWAVKNPRAGDISHIEASVRRVAGSEEGS